MLAVTIQPYDYSRMRSLKDLKSICILRFTHKGLLDEDFAYDVKEDAERELRNLLYSQNKKKYVELLECTFMGVNYHYYNYLTGEKRLSESMTIKKKGFFENFVYFDLPTGISKVDFIIERYDFEMMKNIIKNVSAEKVKMIQLNEDVDRYFIEIENDEDIFNLEAQLSIENFLNREENQVLSRKKQ